MSDLVKRLRGADRGWPTVLSTAADRIEQLDAYKVELEKIAADLGEAGDPFAAWEAVAALRSEREAQQNRIERLERDLAAHKSREEIYKIKAKAGEEYMSQLEEEKALADALAEDLKSAYLYDADSAADEPASLVAHRKARGK